MREVQQLCCLFWALALRQVAAAFGLEQMVQQRQPVEVRLRQMVRVRECLTFLRVWTAAAAQVAAGLVRRSLEEYAACFQLVAVVAVQTYSAVGVVDSWDGLEVQLAVDVVETVQAGHVETRDPEEVHIPYSYRHNRGEEDRSSSRLAQVPCRIQAQRRAGQESHEVLRGLEIEVEAEIDLAAGLGNRIGQTVAGREVVVRGIDSVVGEEVVAGEAAVGEAEERRLLQILIWQDHWASAEGDSLSGRKGW